MGRTGVDRAQATPSSGWCQQFGSKDQLIVIFDGAIVQAVIGTVQHPDAALTAAEALLDAQGVR